MLYGKFHDQSAMANILKNADDPLKKSGNSKARKVIATNKNFGKKNRSFEL